MVVYKSYGKLQMDYCRRDVNVLKENIAIKFGEMIASLALIVTVLNVNSIEYDNL